MASAAVLASTGCLHAVSGSAARWQQLDAPASAGVATNLRALDALAEQAEDPVEDVGQPEPVEQARPIEQAGHCAQQVAEQVARA